MEDPDSGRGRATGAKAAAKRTHIAAPISSRSSEVGAIGGIGVGETPRVKRMMCDGGDSPIATPRK